jgi:acetyl esterase/lipase
LDAGLSRAMALLPRLDYADPAGVRAKMRRYALLAQQTGLWKASDPRVEFDDRIATSRRGVSVPIRHYVPLRRSNPDPAIVFFHGGAFVIGDLDFEHSRCLEMAAETNCIVISVDYRLAPEHPFPAGFDDCCAVYEWAIENAVELGIDSTRIAVAGASAGGALAAAVAQAARDRGLVRPAFQMLLYPVTDDRMTSRSMMQFDDIQGWNRRNSKHMWRHYLGDNVAETSPYAAPARADDLSGLPPAYVMTAELDALCDEGIEYAKRLEDAGVAVQRRHFPEAFHGFDTLANTPVSSRARAEQYACLCAALGVVND